MSRAFLTGASGFIGGALLHELLRRGWEVRALVRPSSDRRNLECAPRNFQVHLGDLQDPASLESGLDGCDALFHVAARYSLWNPRPAEIYADNVDGTRNILEAARRRGVARVVYTSTVGTIRLPPGNVPGDEGGRATLDEVHGHYKRSKLLAEEVAREYAAEGLPVVIVHPSAPVGPFDVKPTPTGQMIVDFLHGRMRAYIETGLNIVAVEDVAAGHILAHDRGRPGEGYILGGENMSLIEVFRVLSETSGIPAPERKIPRSVLAPIALACEAWSRVGGGPPAVSWEAFGLSGRFMYFSSEKARRELGYRSGPAAGALARAVRWFQEKGYAPRLETAGSCQFSGPH